MWSGHYYYYSHLQMIKWGKEKLRRLPKFAQLVNTRVRNWTQAGRLQNPSSLSIRQSLEQPKPSKPVCHRSDDPDNSFSFIVGDSGYFYWTCNSKLTGIFPPTSILKMFSHCLLPPCSPIYNVSFFFNCLSLVFSSLLKICLIVVFFEFILLGICWASQVYRLKYFLPNLEIWGPLCSLNNCSAIFSLSSSSGTPCSILMHKFIF